MPNPPENQTPIDPLPSHMRGVVYDAPGASSVLMERTLPLPGHLDAGFILIQVHACGINRPDILQRRGKYPPPAGASPLLGLEVSGMIAHIPQGTSCPYPVGTRVCALVPGGGYAEYVAVHAGHILPLSDSLSFEDAAALPEGLFTCTQALLIQGQFTPGDRVLIHAGGSGIGTLAIQILRALGAGLIAVTCRSDEKADACRRIGADIAINTRTQDYVDVIRNATHGQGVHIVLDVLGGEYVAKNLSCLADCGRHITIAMQDSASATVDLAPLMLKRIVMTGSTLRHRTDVEKEHLAKVITDRLWPLVETGQIRPVLYKTLPLSAAAAAHDILEQNQNTGKVVLFVRR